MACGRFSSLPRCHVHPAAVQPIFVPLVEEERGGGRELEELKELEEFKRCSGGIQSIARYLREVRRIGKGHK